MCWPNYIYANSLSICSSATLGFLVVATATPSKILLAEEQISGVILLKYNPVSTLEIVRIGSAYGQYSKTETKYDCYIVGRDYSGHGFLRKVYE